MIISYKRKLGWRKGSKHYHHRPSHLLYLWSFIISTCSSEQNFDPYALNGGLVAAVAGPDYVVFASDTRLTSGGYEILSRRHVSSRLWPVSSSPISIPLDENVSSLQNSINGLPVMYQQEWNVSSCFQPPPHTWIASAGCSADCEALKRWIQAEYSLQHDASSTTLNHLQVPKNIATCLANVLYSRRVFPFYSFCILAGLGIENENDPSGVVHIYDAIGSHERVAVACAGTGREILQPILDRLFAESSRKLESATRPTLNPKIQTCSRSWTATVPTHVKCPVDEAVGLLLHGYRAASEREIQVGDSVVVGILQHGSLNERNQKESERFTDDPLRNGVLKSSLVGRKSIRLLFLRYPLKEH